MKANPLSDRRIIIEGKLVVGHTIIIVIIIFL